MNRTDLALETVAEFTEKGVNLKKSRINGLELTHIQIEPDSGIEKPAGNYLTLFCPQYDEKSETDAIFNILSGIIPKTGKIIVAGLGNENITPDSLGVRTVSRVIATAHFTRQKEFNELGMREVYVVETGVLAQTGMESGEQLKYITDGINPDMAVIIDSLACSETSRLGRTVQITDTGIAPGSGVKNSRCEISEKTIGVPIAAIGVPTVIDLETLAPSIGKTYNAMVVPRDIDNTINHFAKIISKALNRTLNPSLSEEEIEQLLF